MWEVKEKHMMQCLSSKGFTLKLTKSGCIYFKADIIGSWHTPHGKFVPETANKKILWKPAQNSMCSKANAGCSAGKLFLLACNQQNNAMPLHQGLAIIKQKMIQNLLTVAEHLLSIPHTHTWSLPLKLPPVILVIVVW